MKLILCDQNPATLDAWRSQFQKRPEVEVRSEDILETAADAIVVPGNSFGFLDSGLGLRVSNAYGWGIQDEIRRRIDEDLDGELLVGEALVLRQPAFPRAIVYAPIWRTPRRLEGTVNVFLAVRGALLAVAKDAAPPPLEAVALPPLGLDEGEIHPHTSARQIRYAYEIVTGQRGRRVKNLSQQTRRERKLVSVPKGALEGGEGDEEDVDG